MSKVSVIVPVYNVERYLPKCIESIQNQTEKDIEIILVDDGSSDGSGVICDRYAEGDARILVIHQENGGLSAARNAGIAKANSDYLIFIDSDDYVDSDLIEKTYEAVLSTDADIVVYGYVKVMENGETSYVYDLPMQLEEGVFSIETKPELLLMTPSACNKLFSKSLFDEVKFPLRAWYEDLYTIPKLYTQAANICCLRNFYPYKYLTRENSIMTSGNIEKTKKDRIAAVDSVLAYYKGVGLYEKFADELNWLYIYHGYFLPCREIMNFQGNTVLALKELRTNLLQKLPAVLPERNPYYTSLLTKREKFIFSMLFKQKYTLLHLFVKVNQLLKK